MIFRLLTSMYRSRIKWIKLRRMLSIPRGQLVIDIGGGDGPFPRADVVCEKFISDDSERTNSMEKGSSLSSQALVMGDIEYLPFVDGAFDFVYCSHILEHAQDPAAAVREITRIGKRGYIEVPSEYLELTATSTPSHLWTITTQGDGVLSFKRKSKASPQPSVDRAFREALWEKDASYMAFHWKNYYRLFNIGLLWEKRISIRVQPSEDPVREETFQKGDVGEISVIEKSLQRLRGRTQSGGGWRARLKRAVTRFFTARLSEEKLRSLLACPRCKQTLSAGDRILNCSHCRVNFPFLHGVPVLLDEFSSPQ